MLKEKLTLQIPTMACIKLIAGDMKIVPITDIKFKDGSLYSVIVEYPLGNNNYDYLTYYFDGRKLGEEKNIDVNEVFMGFVKPEEFSISKQFIKETETTETEMLNLTTEKIREAIRDIIWMARRYVDGRQNYSVGMFNDAYDILRDEFGDIDLQFTDTTLTDNGKYFPYAYDKGGDMYNDFSKRKYYKNGLKEK